MKIEIIYPNQKFFAHISNVDITTISNEEFYKIQRAIDTYGVIVIKNQPLNDEQQIKFSKKFGKLETPLKKDMLKGIAPEITRISNVGVDGKKLEVRSEKVIYDRENQLEAFNAKIKPILGRSFRPEEFANITDLNDVNDVTL